MLACIPPPRLPPFASPRPAHVCVIFLFWPFHLCKRNIWKICWQDKQQGHKVQLMPPDELASPDCFLPPWRFNEHATLQRAPFAHRKQNRVRFVAKYYLILFKSMLYEWKSVLVSGIGGISTRFSQCTTPFFTPTFCQPASLLNSLVKRCTFSAISRQR